MSEEDTAAVDSIEDVAVDVADVELAAEASDPVDPLDEDRVGADSVVGDYGVDAPGVVRGVAWAAGIAFAITLIAAVANVLVLMFVALGITIVLTFEALSLVWSSRVAKLRERVQVIDLLGLGGGEWVLDVGCGRGLLLVEAARRLTTGRVFGVDVWRDTDQTENDPEFPLINAEIEQVDDRTIVTTADARMLPFEDESFDAVVSSMALHTIESFDGQVHAVREIDRVLAPGGRLVVIDSKATRQYVDALRSCNWAEVAQSRRIYRMFPPVRYVTGRKPGGADEVMSLDDVEAAEAAEALAAAAAEEAAVDTEETAEDTAAETEAVDDAEDVDAPDAAAEDDDALWRPPDEGEAADDPDTNAVAVDPDTQALRFNALVTESPEEKPGTLG